LWKSFQHKLQTARQLSLLDWLGLVEAWWLLLGFNLAIRWMPFERLQARLRSDLEEGSLVTPEALAWAWHRQRLVSLASRLHLLSMTCLPRALALSWLMRRHGIPARLCIGMNKSPEEIYAHAWVEAGGQAIGEPEDIEDRFKKLQGAANPLQFPDIYNLS
jgi:hypothetical protein